jgi:hypothetical protein
MKYIPLNKFLLIEKKETNGLVVAGQDEDPNATLHGIIKVDDYYLNDEEVVFVRGQARKIKLDSKEYFLVPEDKILLQVKKD